MAERKNTHALRLTRRHGAITVDIGKMEIWDGADLSLVRDTLNTLIARRRQRSVGVQMKYVKYVPSGFFGMLYDYYEAGIAVHLFTPQPCVAAMVWFQRFFVEERPGMYRLEDIHEAGLDAEIGHPEEAASWDDKEAVHMTKSLLAVPAC
ncbi:MAG: hypothetical protein R3C01_07690 [Planctomycetaceae bacterium]